MLNYAALAAVALPDSELNSYVDVGWSTLVNGELLAAAFSKAMGKPFKAKPIVPAFIFGILSFFSLLINRLKDTTELVKWPTAEIAPWHHYSKIGIYYPLNVRSQDEGA